MTTTLPTTNELRELLPWATDSERAELDNLIRPVLRSTERAFSPQAPTPKQAEFLNLACFEALFGGAAGGGKSSALLMAALEHVGTPGYAALLLRRTYADLSLPGALMDRAATWLRGTEARWRDQTKTWAFPSGATVTFGYLETEQDKYRYQGSEYLFVGFDELTQFTESQYRYLLSRIRRPATGALSQVPLRARAASNPGGVGHEWVKRYFLEAPPEEGRVFVPARLEDNPHLDVEEYDAALARLDPVTRRQLRLGDWDAVAQGNLFRREWFPVVEARPQAGTWVRYWDLASTDGGGDWSVGTLLGRLAGNTYVVADVKREQLGPRALENLVLSTAQQDGRACAVVFEEEPGSSGKIVTDHYRRNVLPGWNVRGIRSTGDKVERARPLSAQAEAKNIAVVRGAWDMTGWFDRLESFPTEGVNDDEIDSASGALAYLTPPRTRLALAVGQERTY